MKINKNIKFSEKVGEYILTFIKSMPIGLFSLLILHSFEPFNLMVSWLLFLLFAFIHIYFLIIPINEEQNNKMLIQLITFYPLVPLFENLREFYF